VAVSLKDLCEQRRKSVTTSDTSTHWWYIHCFSRDTIQTNEDQKTAFWQQPHHDKFSKDKRQTMRTAVTYCLYGRQTDVATTGKAQRRDVNVGQTSVQTGGDRPSPSPVSCATPLVWSPDVTVRPTPRRKIWLNDEREHAAYVRRKDVVATCLTSCTSALARREINTDITSEKRHSNHIVCCWDR